MSDLAKHPHPRTSLVVYVPVVVLLYIGDLVTGVWLLFYGLQLPTWNVSLLSLLNWFGASILCYFAYRRSHTFGHVLVALTVALTALIVAAVFLIALFSGMLSDA